MIRLKNVSPSHHKYVFESLRANNIGVQLHYIPVHLQPYYRSLGFSDGDFPEAEFIQVLLLVSPCTPVSRLTSRKGSFKLFKYT